jgi:hypothetical protein
MSNTSMQVPEGYQIVTRVGYRIPDTFHSLQAARVTGRKWWQFWLPETVNIYMTVEKIPSANIAETLNLPRTPLTAADVHAALNHLTQ